MVTYVTRRSKRWKQQQYLDPTLYSYPSSQPSPRFYPQSAFLPNPWRCSWEHWQLCCISILGGPCGSPCCQAGICTRRCGIMRWTPGSSQARETRSRALRRAWLPWTGSLNDYGDYEEYVDLLTLLLAAHHVLDKVYRDGFYSVGNKRLAIRKGATHRTWGGRRLCPPRGSCRSPVWICTWPWTPWLWPWLWPEALQTRCCFAWWFVCSNLTF